MKTTEEVIARLRELANTEHDDSPLSCELKGYVAQRALLYLLELGGEYRGKGIGPRTFLYDLKDTIEELEEFYKEAEKLVKESETQYVSVTINVKKRVTESDRQRWRDCEAEGLTLANSVSEDFFNYLKLYALDVSDVVTAAVTEAKETE